jgi:hypothetical protein
MLAIVIGGIPRRIESINDLRQELQTRIAKIPDLKLAATEIPVSRLDPVVKAEKQGIFVRVVENETDPFLFPTIAMIIGETIATWLDTYPASIIRQRQFIRVAFVKLHFDIDVPFQRNLGPPKKE